MSNVTIDKKINVIKSTTDYEQFITLRGNRAISTHHVAQLIKSFQKHYLFSPIMINEQNEVIDGQHRLTAAKELGLPVFYMVNRGYGLDQVKMMNKHASNWTKQQYLDCYADLKYPEYVKFRNFLNQYPEFLIGGCEVLLCGVSRRKKEKLKGDTSTRITSTDFKEGEFRVNDYHQAQKTAEQLREIGPYYDSYYQGTFVNAMAKIHLIDLFSHKHLMKQFAKYGSKPRCIIQKSMKTKYYRNIIEEIYNIGCHRKTNLRF